mgnify:CR=1 FL=1|jgi:hypothetical protein|tara:strand:- start:3825 stop:4322 length:498 start_codon:yes stop_codon:yes gene_type:complete
MVGYYSDKDTKSYLYPNSEVESKKVLRMMKNPDMEYFLLSDASPKKPFIDYLDNNNLDYDISELKRIINDTYPVIMSIKKYYNRPRPQKVNNLIKAQDSETANTPSYPAGHTFQSYVIAKSLSKIHPLHTFKFYRIAERIAKSRVSAGLHYPSDNTFSRHLARYF